MIELVLSGIIVALLVYHYLSMKQVKEERKDLVDKIVTTAIAKNASEYRDMELAKNTEIKLEPPTPPDFEPIENLTDEEHAQAIKNQLEDDR